MKNRNLITNTETYVGVFGNDGSISRWRIYITSGIFNKGWSASGLFAKDYFNNDQEKDNENFLDNFGRL
jgi:hypothetical protein